MEVRDMPLYMDRHEFEGAKPEDVAAAHLRDLDVQGKYGVKYLTYWLDYKAGNGFCLVESPSKEAAETVHREAHGFVGSEIIEVEWGAVESFLGNIGDTSAAQRPAEPVTESAFRTVLFSDMVGSTEYTQRFGDDKHLEILRRHDSIIRESLASAGGREVKHTGDGIMASFASVARAIESAIDIQRGFAAHNEERPDEAMRVRLGLSAGEPVAESDDLFGAAVQLASRICGAAEGGQILVPNVVRELSIGKGFVFDDRGEARLRGFPEPVRLYEVVWQA
ncbi:MAG: nickel-binding protein [Dehalococcoidia bacterium]